MSQADSLLDFLVEPEGFKLINGEITKTVPDRVRSLSLGLYNKAGELSHVQGICGTETTGLPAPSFSAGDKHIWLLEEIVDADKDYERIESVVDRVNPHDPDAPLDPAVDWRAVKAPAGDPALYTLDALLRTKGTRPKAAPVAEIAPAILDRMVSLGMSNKGRSDMFWRNKTASFGSLLDMFRNHKAGEKDGACILQGSLVGSRRTATAVEKLDLLILDLDTGDDIDVIEQRIRDKGWLAAIYTTHSHLKASTDVKKDAILKFADAETTDDIDADVIKRYLREEKRYRPAVLKTVKIGKPVHKDSGIVYEVSHSPMPKFRIVFLLSEPFVIAERGGSQKAAIDEWKQRYAGVATLLDAAFDRSCVDPSRLMYLPRHPKGAKEFFTRVIPGKPLDINTVPLVDIKRKGPTNAFMAAGIEERGELANGWLKAFAAKYGERFEAADFCAEHLETREDRGDKMIFACPNDDNHSNAGDPEDKGFFAVNSTASQHGGFMLKCMHDSCAEIDRLGMLDLICQDAGLGLDDLKAHVSEVEGDDDEDEGETAPTTPQAAGEPPPEPKKLRSYDAMDAYLNARAELTRDQVQKVIEGLARITPENEDVLRKEAVMDGIAAKNKVFKKRAIQTALKAAQKKARLEGDDDADERMGTSQDYLKKMNAMNEQYALIRAGKSWGFLREHDGFEAPDIYNSEGFKIETMTLGTVAVPMPNGEVREMEAFEAWQRWPGRREYRGGIVFDPSDTNKSAYNTWRGFQVKGKPGDFPLIHKHIWEVYCHENEEYFNWFMSWLAQMIQQPAKKMGSAVVVRGLKGTGKSIILDLLMGKLLGKHFMKTAKVDHVIGRFNMQLSNKCFVFFEEATWGGNKTDDSALKDLITSDKMMYEAKGEALIEGMNCTRIAFAANEVWVVPASEDERRYFVLETDPKYMGNIAYFDALVDEIENEDAVAAFMHCLETWKVPNNDWNFLRTPPDTIWLEQQKAWTRDARDDYFFALVDDGMLSGVDSLDILEQALHVDKPTTIVKRDLREHFMFTVKRAGVRRTSIADFELYGQKYLGVDIKNAPREIINGVETAVIKVPPLNELRDRFKRKYG